mgnify:CR=1 FL=1
MLDLVEKLERRIFEGYLGYGYFIKKLMFSLLTVFLILNNVYSRNSEIIIQKEFNIFSGLKV